MSEKQKETNEKPLEKMTVKDLREMAKEIPEITGVHGMKKDELVQAIKDAKGMEDELEIKKEPSIEKVKEKPLEKKTVKDLREMAQEIPEITGVHGMKKDELIKAIKDAKGMEDKPKKKKISSIQEIKKKIKELKSQRKEALKAKNNRMAKIYKRRISRLKKKSRRAA